MIASSIQKDLEDYANPQYAQTSQRFFKTGKGEYGEGDTFIGVRVPYIRKVCKTYPNVPLEEISTLLYSPIHEYRLAAVLLLRGQYENGDFDIRKRIYRVYLRGLADSVINNWDIVDISAGAILGAYSRTHSTSILYTLARKGNLWEKRAAIIATSAYIQAGDPKPSLEIAELYISEQHDLLHKAAGWMLREVGKQISKRTLLHFLKSHATQMPRVMLRYSCEKLTPSERKYYYSL